MFVSSYIKMKMFCSFISWHPWVWGWASDRFLLLTVFSLCLPFCFSGYSVHLRCTNEGVSLVSVCCPAVLSLLSGLYRVHGLRVSSRCHVARWHFLPPLSFQKVFVCCCCRCFLSLLFHHTSFVFIFGLLAISYPLLACLIRAAILNFSFRLHLFTSRCYVIGSPDQRFALSVCRHCVS